uniref:Uncharacterized protein n=1 Tax=Oryza sativa subsp. japonica TaxID=39947 RepID=Q6UUC9_ORYSJ|nr:hypothetical protein OSJNBa0074N12.6 [Oryza sativa Japonica Group]
MAEFDGGVDEVALGRANPKTTTARLGGGASGGRRRGEGGGGWEERIGGDDVGTARSGEEWAREGRETAPAWAVSAAAAVVGG